MSTEWDAHALGYHPAPQHENEDEYRADDLDREPADSDDDGGPDFDPYAGQVRDEYDLDREWLAWDGTDKGGEW